MVADLLTKIVKADGQRLPRAERQTHDVECLPSVEPNILHQVRGHFIDTGLRELVVAAWRPDTPTAPTTSSPTLIGKPGYREYVAYSLPTEPGSLSVRLTKSADEVPKVRALLHLSMAASAITLPPMGHWIHASLTTPAPK